MTDRDQTADLVRAATWLQAADAVAVMTGAGISAESGVPTFRDGNGLWDGNAVEDVATPTGFQRNPKLVWQFYNGRRANLAEVQPNPAHLALVELEQRLGPGFTLITQNVDGLHRQAGSRRLLEIHGNLRQTICTNCGDFVDRGLEPLGPLPKCEKCGALLRPNVVWFEESLPEELWDEAVQATQACDVFLVIGTSAVVHPAAQLIDIARQSAARVIEVNLHPSAASSRADVFLRGPAGTLVPQLVLAD